MMKGPSAPAVAIVAKLKPKPKGRYSEPEASEEDSGGEEDMELKAASEVMAALKADDPTAFSDAMKAFLDSCGY